MSSRPLMSAVAAQQKAMATLAHENRVLRLQLAFVARLAGVTEHLAAIRKECDADNPAQPVPNPASQPATESTEETVTPLAYDNPNTPGATSNANKDVGAAATTTPMAPGTAIPTNPYNDLVDVTAPVSGTETHIPNNQTRIESDVRVGDPMNPEMAFPLNPAFGDAGLQAPAKAPASGEMSQTKGASRTLASLRLAKLRIEAGLAQGDEFEVTAAIEADGSIGMGDIQNEIRTLSQVARVSKRQQRPANLVPKAAAQTPRVSLQSTAAQTDDDDDDSLFF